MSKIPNILDLAAVKIVCEKEILYYSFFAFIPVLCF